MRSSLAILVLGAVACNANVGAGGGAGEPFSDTAAEAGDDTADGPSDGLTRAPRPAFAAPADTAADTDVAVDTAADTAADTAPTDTAGDTAGDTGSDTGSDTGGVRVVADSVSEYSATQGDYGWYYGYVEPSTSAEWVEMPHYLSGGSTPGWYSDPEHYWTSLAGDAAHPNGLVTSGGRSPMEQWAVRRWVSDEVGVLHVSSHIAKNYEDGTTNGIDARVMVDGVEASSLRIEGWDTVGVDETVDVVVGIGSVIDFELDPHEAEDLSDRTTWTIVITQ